jgi:hypothetical protein
MKNLHVKVQGHDEWLTPPEIVERLGTFDLDPCSPIIRPWNTARQHYTIEDNGLSKQWLGRVWCNPPYGNVSTHWVSRCAQHGNAIVLLFARTDTRLFQEHIFGRADGLLFIKGRIKFRNVQGFTVPSGNGGAPSVLVAYGAANAQCLKECGIAGAFCGFTQIISENG